jgi:hypothetical protein
MRGSHCKSTTYDECVPQCALVKGDRKTDSKRENSDRFINPHRLFHGVWIPQWLEERPEVSEKAKKLYAYLTYFAGNKGYAWPSFRVLAEKLHCSRRHVVRIVQELSAHGLIQVTNVSNPTRGHCSNYYRFLAHPWMQTKADGNFVMEAEEHHGSPFEGDSTAAVNPGDVCVTSPLVTSRTPPPDDRRVTRASDPRVTPLMTPMSPKENKRKRTIERGKEPVRSAEAHPTKPASVTASPPPRVLSDTSKIMLERRIAELRKEVAASAKRDDHAKAERLHAELAQHQAALGFTPDDPPIPPKARREEDSSRLVSVEDWPSPEEVKATFNALRRSAGLPIKP